MVDPVDEFAVQQLAESQERWDMDTVMRRRERGGGGFQPRDVIVFGALHQLKVSSFHGLASVARPGRFAHRAQQQRGCMPT